MSRLSDYEKYKLTEDQKRRMSHGTKVILGALLLSILAVIVIVTFPDWDSVICRGGYCD